MPPKKTSKKKDENEIQPVDDDVVIEVVEQDKSSSDNESDDEDIDPKPIKEKGKRKPINTSQNDNKMMKNSSPSNAIRQRPVSPTVLSSPHVLRLKTSDEDNSQKKKEHKESEGSRLRKGEEKKRESIDLSDEELHNEIQESNLNFEHTQDHENSEKELDEIRPAKSPAIRDKYSDLKKETYENILANFYYNVIASIENSKDKVIFLICCDPTGNTVYIDIREDKNEGNSYEVSTSNIRTIKVANIKKMDCDIDDSIINCYEETMGTITYGFAIHSGNKLVIITQDNDSEKTAEYYKISTTNTKNMEVYPIILFDEIIADEDEAGEPCYAIDIVKGTLISKERIMKTQKETGRNGINRVKKGVKEVIELINSIGTLYEESMKKNESKKNEIVDVCLDIYEKYDENEEGLEPEEKEEYEESRFCSDAIGKNMNYIITVINQTDNTIMPQLLKVITDLTNVRETLKTNAKNIGNEKFEKDKKIVYEN